jgi:hypothetical protein
MDLLHGHAAWFGSIGMQSGHAKWTCMMDRHHDTQHGHEAWAYSMDMDMQNECEIASWMPKYAQAAWPYTCSSDMNMLHGHGHAVQT